MPTYVVRPVPVQPNEYGSIQAALDAAFQNGVAGDTVIIDASYLVAETATVLENGLTLQKDTSQAGIVVTLGSGVTGVTVTGAGNVATAPITVVGSSTGPIAVDQAMVRQMLDYAFPQLPEGPPNIPTSGIDSSPITYSVDVDPGSFVQDFAEDFASIFGGWDPQITPMSSSVKAALTATLVELWDDVIARDIVYSPNDESADIIINQVSNMKPGANGVTVSTLHTVLPTDVDVYLTTNPLTLGTPAWKSAVHELGHALGLQHPGDYNAEPGAIYTQEYAADTGRYSIMSYFEPGYDGSAANWARSGQLTPTVYDIIAAQRFYGQDTTSRLGDTTYGFNSNADRGVYYITSNVDPIFTIWDAGGDHDRLDVSGFTVNQRVDLTPGSYSDVGVGTGINTPTGIIGGLMPNNPTSQSTTLVPNGGQPLFSNVGIAFDTWIEDAVGGGGNDQITGNGRANYLEGGAGNDAIWGRGGEDTISGGAGLDALFGEDGADTLTGGLNNDQLYGGAGSDDLDGEGNNDLLRGEAGDDVLKGSGGNDTLFGGAGIDVLNGGDNDDILDGSGRAGPTSDGPNPEVLTGGSGRDVFVYGTGYGRTVITDFNADPAFLDSLDLRSTGIHSFPDLLAAAQAAGADTVLNFGQGNELTLSGVSPDELDPGTVLFSEADPKAEAGFLWGVDRAHLASLPSGGFVDAAYGASGAFFGSGPVGIYARLHDARGAVVNIVQANATAPSDPAIDVNYARGLSPEPVVCGLADGGFVIAWASNDPGGGGQRCIRARIFGPDGEPEDPEFIVNTTPAIDQAIPGGAFPVQFNLIGVTAKPDGGFVVAWRDDEAPGLDQNAPVARERAFDANGLATGPDMLVAVPPLSDDPDIILTLAGGATLSVDYVATGGYGQPGFHYNYYATIPGLAGPVDLFGDQIIPNYSTATELADGRIAFTLLSRVIILNPDLTGATFPGTPEPDILTGSGFDDRIFGLGGNDILIGRLGPDLLDGGEGEDEADYSRSLGAVTVDLTTGGPQAGGHAAGDTLVSVENLRGSAYADTLTGDASRNVIRAGYGTDTVDGGGGPDLLFGEQGDDRLVLRGPGGEAYGGPGTDVILDFGALAGYRVLDGGAGDDRIYGANGDGTNIFAGSGSDFVIAGSGADFIVLDDDAELAFDPAAGNRDELDAGGGGDRISTFGGGDVIDGGPGFDIVELDLSWSDQGRGLGLVELPKSLGGVPKESAYGLGEGSAVYDVEQLHLTLGGGSNAVAWGAAPAGLSLVMLGGGGRDELQAGAGNDTLFGRFGDDVLFGGAGDDLLSGGPGLDQLWGGPGSDTLIVERSDLPVYVDLRGGIWLVGGVLTDTFNSIENIDGSDGRDVLVGNEEANVLRGRFGADLLFGFGGDDLLIGDYPEDGSFNQLWGGQDSDTASYDHLGNYVRADLAAGGAWSLDFDGALVLFDLFNSIENLVGTFAADMLAGDDGPNRLAGGEGADSLYGRGGADTFVFRLAADSSIADGYDTIADFSRAEGDRVDLSAFGLDPGRVLIASDAASTALYADTDLGTAGYELAVAFVGANAVEIGDVVF